ncbi:hypothetical protein SAMN05660831_00061 [Thiohalospira halophila DSM 15071]|uniref:Uncharacterized protein n=1 Tax=Thiohalospira halophila DSM 15071 TaxID=1123397 RepID=A0A1I1N133_9GAMM|nr:hypothetical protein [Thiohalospira halophila]SFC91337.1 hypothetical protein SAMN05660831_00061 [Thiohalospira halophila DSM 15071]
MAKNPLTLVTARRVPADQLVKQAIGSARAGQTVHRVERMYPRIQAPLEGVADALLDHLEVEEARAVLGEGLTGLRNYWDADMGAWRSGELDAMGLLRQILTRLFQPAVQQLGEATPEVLRFQAAPSGERLEGNRVWADLRLRQLGLSGVDDQDGDCVEE